MASPHDSPVIAVRTRIEQERGRWVVYVDAICVPDHDDYVLTHRISDHATADRARIAAQWIERIANIDHFRP
jgi:hypothetical protein